MTTTLRHVGDELALILDREALASLGIDGETRLEVSIDDRGIHIRPADDHRTLVMASAMKMMEIHDVTFRKLAQ